MTDKERRRILEEASAFAHQVIRGEITPKAGCAQIAAIHGARNVRELDELTHLAHLQNGDHDKLGFSADSCAPAIVEECRTLLEATDMKVNLHDAILERIEVHWREQICRCFVRAWHAGESKALCVEFTGITDISIPRAEPWGPSSSILEHTQNADTHAITMQSGDIIRLRAKAWTVVSN
jgi:hypothetical protein